jgi:hypothetical protein
MYYHWNHRLFTSQQLSSRKILQKTCSFDLGMFNGTCSDNFNVGTNDTRTDYYTKCQNQAAIQYVRCTIQKPSDKVESCVVDNAVKIDWLPQIQTYNGATSCLSITGILLTQLVNIFAQVVKSLLPLFLWKFKRGSQRQKPSQNAPAKSLWVKETCYVLKAGRVVVSIGKEVLTSFLSVVILSKYGVFSRPTLLDEFAFYAIRPRHAPVTGTLGIFQRWSEQGLADLVVDGMLSCVASTSQIFLFLL